MWETLAVLQDTKHNNLPVVFEDVRVHHLLEIPERGMCVHCKHNEYVIEIGRCCKLEETIVMFLVFQINCYSHHFSFYLLAYCL